MTDLQSKLLEMLKEIDVICRKYQITYYLIGGSALGAVRDVYKRQALYGL